MPNYQMRDQYDRDRSARDGDGYRSRASYARPRDSQGRFMSDDSRCGETSHFDRDDDGDDGQYRVYSRYDNGYGARRYAQYDDDDDDEYRRRGSSRG